MEELRHAYLECDRCVIWVSNLEDLLNFVGERTCDISMSAFLYFVGQYIRWKPSSTGSSSTDMVAVDVCRE